MRFLLSAITLLFASTFPMVAHADPIYPVIGGAGGFSGSGTLTASNNGDGSYTVVGITGTGVTGLISPGGFNSNDNLLFPGTSNAFDTNGFSFSDTMGNTDFEINIASNGAGSYFLYLFDSDGYSATMPVDLTIGSTPAPSFSTQRRAFFNHQNAAPATQDFTFSFDSVAATPEPSSLMLLGTGLVAAAGAASRRRFKFKE